MKKHILRTVLILGTSLSLIGCKDEVKIVDRKEFDIRFISNADDKTFTTSDANYIYINEFDTFTVKVELSNDQWDSKWKDSFIRNDGWKHFVTFDYDKAAIILKSEEHSKLNKSFNYTFGVCSYSTAFDFKVTFDNNTYDYHLKTKAYSFEDTKKISETELTNNYPEFKEMVDSISYHEFESPYVGVDSTTGSSYWKYRTWTSDDFEESYNTNYLKYFTDSSYYPKKMNLGYPNIGSRFASMTIEESTNLNANAPKSMMLGFEIAYVAIDPHCTHPTNHLKNLIFRGFPLNFKSSSTYMNRMNDNNAKCSLFTASLKYPERFLHYKVNELDISVIECNDCINGFFSDGIYGYWMQSAYID